MIATEGVEVLGHIPDDVRKFVSNKLREHGAAAGAPINAAAYSFIKRNSEGKIVAALNAERFWQCFYVDQLWVDESLRSKGVGTSLMRMAEATAREQDCTSVYLWTADWQATEFYAKLGFTKLATIAHSPVGHERHFYIKYLSEKH